MSTRIIFKTRKKVFQRFVRESPPTLSAVFSSRTTTGRGSWLETVRADLTAINFRAEPSRLTSKTTRTAERSTAVINPNGLIGSTTSYLMTATRPEQEF